MDKPGGKEIDGALVWFRRDLRAEDHAALYHALRSARRVHCVFVFDTEILEPLRSRGLRRDRRVEFIRDSVAELDERVGALGAAAGVAGAGLIVRHGPAGVLLPRLAAELNAQAVYANHDDDPGPLERDARIRGALAAAGVALHTGKDHVVFERGEVLTRSGEPYSVFTPYREAWLARLEPFYLAAWPVDRHAAALAPLPANEPPSRVPTLAQLGFEPTGLAALHVVPGERGARQRLDDFLARIDRYDSARDYPAQKGPSYLGVHLRFGTLSIRRAAREAEARASQGSAGARVWLSELIWREFFQQVLHHHPHVVDRAFRPAYDRIRFEHGHHAHERFDAWCEGRTGYPLVDAAMMQLEHSGYMHNRLRMVTASFLVKDLGIDWRWGERWFADRLIDFELGSNNGGWQWAAGTGCDAQPWFRVFNPVTQSRRFDPEGAFIRRYLPQLAALPDALLHAPWQARPVELAAAGIVLGRDYPWPIVDHEAARRRTLERSAAVRGG
ncbi:MAG TPA: deoxyribodipyrimidine photo-lyase [Ideonella sp.]|nr:deoxyribodipyrimidine photo-lyase [Ideonella sp.]